MMINYTYLQDGLMEIKDEIKTMRNRQHENENNIASQSALVFEMQTNAEWIISSIEKMQAKIEEINSRQNKMLKIESELSSQIMVTKFQVDLMIKMSDKLSAKFEDLLKSVNKIIADGMQEKMDHLNKIKNIIFSSKTWYFLLFSVFSIIAFSDKLTLSENISNIHKMLGH